MKINRNNYEIWFLDFYEGRLIKDQVKELMIFLEHHYDLKEEFNQFEHVSLPPINHIYFDAKESLKKPVIASEEGINENNYINYFLRKVENDLTAKELIAFANFLRKNAFLEKELKGFQKTKSSPDKNITFPYKKELKKKRIVPVGFINENNYTSVFIAAVENDLNNSQYKNFTEFLKQNPILQNEYNLFGKTKLIPDATIVLKDKNQLKKNKAAINIAYFKKIYYPLSIAASIVVILTIYFLFKNETSTSMQFSYREINVNKRALVENTILKSQLKTKEISCQNTEKVKAYKEQKNAAKIIKHEGIKNVQPLKSGLIIQNKKLEQHEFMNSQVIQDYMAMRNEKDKKEEGAIEREEYISLKKYIFNKLAKSLVLDDKKVEITEKNNEITFADVANAGVRKLASLTGVDAILNRENKTDDFYLAVGNKFEITRKSKK